MFRINHNPDVLSCLANLSNDEVFTPPSLVNDILDLLPADLWTSPETTFLDPVCKSGVFLREIAKRLMEGLKEAIPDQQQRIDNIFTRQLYGIGITELTSLLSRRSVYCSKTANGKYSIVDAFTNDQGNIKYDRIRHTWKKGRCVYCGAKESEYSRDDALENYAYEFIHTDNPENIFDMRFDVIVGNPPYQLSDGGHGRSASPIYDKFVAQAKRLNPRYLSMIIPARWYAGGKGLDGFREEMLNDSHIRVLVDHENSNDIFPGVDVAGGICYFLWERNNPGLCKIVNYNKGSTTASIRELNRYDILIRHQQAISIIDKAAVDNPEQYLSDVVSASKPFGLRTFYKPKNSGIPCWFNQRTGRKLASQEDVSDNHNLLDKWKLLVPTQPIAGQTDFTKPVRFYSERSVIVADPGDCCTESYLVVFSSDRKEEVLLFKSYLFTKIFRFLLLQCVVSQHVTRDKFRFIPDLGTYDQTYTDEILRERWNITDEEWAFIDSKIK